MVAADETLGEQIKTVITTFTGAKRLQRVAQLLDEEKAPVNDQDVLCGWTPLLMAVRTGDLVLVDALIGRGADLSQANSQGFTAAHYAVIHAADCVTWRERRERDADTSTAATPMSQAVTCALRAAQDAGCPAFAMTALLLSAAGAQSHDEEDRAARRKAVLCARTRSRWTPVAHAVMGQDLSMVAALSAAGADIRAVLDVRGARDALEQWKGDVGRAARELFDEADRVFHSS